MLTNPVSKKDGQEIARTEPTYDRPWFQPRVNIFETAEELILQAKVPGAESSDIDVQFEKRGKAAKRTCELPGFALSAVPLT